jgi:hypothetical protein
MCMSTSQYEQHTAQYEYEYITVRATYSPTSTDVPVGLPTSTDVPVGLPTSTDVPVGLPTSTDVPVGLPALT